MAIWNSTSRTEYGVAVIDRSPKAPTITPRIEIDTFSEAQIEDYKTAAKAAGVDGRDILVEEFRAFLAKHDIPTFSLGEVVKYMDDLVAKDNATGFGWQWCPVRPKDAAAVMTFGQASREDRSGHGPARTPASDFYESHRMKDWHEGRGGFHGEWAGGWMSGSSSKEVVVRTQPTAVDMMQREVSTYGVAPPRRPDWRNEPSPAYTRTIPLHALKKIALVENSFKACDVTFLVSDYCVAPHVVINPDPFLMAVIPNSAVAHGKGRFVIDVWDEPGFGIAQMIAR